MKYSIDELINDADCIEELKAYVAESEFFSEKELSIVLAVMGVFLKDRPLDIDAFLAIAKECLDVASEYTYYDGTKVVTKTNTNRIIEAQMEKFYSIYAGEGRSR